jgi:hypothetical protein
MNGKVTNVGSQYMNDYGHLIGRNVHMSGYILFEGGAPATAPGIFRVN